MYIISTNIHMYMHVHIHIYIYRSIHSARGAIRIVEPRREMGGFHTWEAPKQTRMYYDPYLRDSQKGPLTCGNLQ